MTNVKSLVLRPLHYKILVHLAIAEEGTLTRYKLSDKIFNRNYVTLISRYISELQSAGLVTLHTEKRGRRKKVFVSITKQGFNALLEKPNISYDELEDYVMLALKEMKLKSTELDNDFEYSKLYHYNLIANGGIVIRIEDGFRPILSNVLSLLAEIKNDESRKRRSAREYFSPSSFMKNYEIETFEDKRLIAVSPSLVKRYRGIIIFTGNHPKKILAQINKILPESENEKEKQREKQKYKGLSKKDLEKVPLESPSYFLNTFKKILEEAILIIDEFASPGSRFRVIFAGDLSVLDFLNTLKHTIQELQKE